MWLFVGLGNPRPGDAGNRHNIGFMAVDRIHDRHGFKPWRSRYRGLASDGNLAGEKVLLLKPLTYMNLSGESVGEAQRFFKIAPEQVVVFYDEIDLQPGRVKVKKGGGSGGHNGIRSIAAAVDPDFWRVRLGVGHPGHKDLVHPWVLNDFAKTDREWLAKLLDVVAAEAPLLIEGRDGEYMNRAALALFPPRPKPPRKPPPPPETDPET
ncbi:MAG: aminoacyl-tRNA hydrolase [Alphaproteobacteria bacterium]|nr:aminoacyl-tRNA hydrolase [Alphaproteobacteria bacterium]